MPFSKGHRPPRVGSGEVVKLEVGVVIFEDLVGIPEEEPERPVGAPEEIPDVGVVELTGPLGGTDVEP